MVDRVDCPEEGMADRPEEGAEEEVVVVMAEALINTAWHQRTAGTTGTALTGSPKGARTRSIREMPRTTFLGTTASRRESIGARW